MTWIDRELLKPVCCLMDAGEVKDVAPEACREEEIFLSDVFGVGVNVRREFDGLSEHNVTSDVFVGKF